MYHCDRYLPGFFSSNYVIKEADIKYSMREPSGNVNHCAYNRCQCSLHASVCLSKPFFKCKLMQKLHHFPIFSLFSSFRPYINFKQLITSHIRSTTDDLISNCNILSVFLRLHAGIKFSWKFLMRFVDYSAECLTFLAHAVYDGLYRRTVTTEKQEKEVANIM